jgi:ferredoxin
MNITILRNECCGNGECVAIAPDVFGLDSKNKAIVLDEEASDPALVLSAAIACPCQAIVLVDDDGAQVHP